MGMLELKNCSSREHHFYDGAVIIKRRAAAEVRNGVEDFLRATLLCRRFQSLVVEKFAGSVFGFSDAICYKNQSVTTVQAVVVALVSRVGQQTDRQVSVRRTNDFIVANQERRYMSTIDVFQFSIMAQTSNDDSCVFCSDAFAG